MEFRRKIVQTTPTTEAIRIYSSLSELVNETLCEIDELDDYHNKKCVERTCVKCGVKKFNLLTQEKSTSTDEYGSVKWNRYL